MPKGDIGFGLGLRPEHYEEIAANPGRVDWFEALSENYMVSGGIPLHWLERIRRDYPNAPLVAHPECPKAVRMLADEVCSTEKMVTYCKQAKSPQIIIATEAGMLHRLQKECPDKQFIAAPTDNCRCNECRFMKMNTLEKLHDCMLHGTPQVSLPPEIIERARLPIERMLEISARP